MLRCLYFLSDNSKYNFKQAHNSDYTTEISVDITLRVLFKVMEHLEILA